MTEPADSSLADAPPLEGIIDAPEIYIDGYQGALRTGVSVKFNLYSLVLDTTPGSPRRRCPAILTMGLPTLVAVHAALGDFIKQLEAEGAITRSDGEAA